MDWFQRLIGRSVTPLVERHLRRRAARGKEDAARLAERLGRASLPRPPGPLAWLHAASLGEATSVLPLITRIKTDLPELFLLVTTGTVSSAELLRDALPPGCLHQYAPVDLPDAVAAFLDHWRPDLALWVESEFWPLTLQALSRRQIPRALVNGRMSPRSYRRWQLFRPMIRKMLSGFEVVLAGSAQDARRLHRLGARKVQAVGNLKFTAPALAVEGAELERLQAALAERPRWLMASTHAGEEEIAGLVHRRLSADHGGLLTLLVPRHPRRGGEIAGALSRQGLRVALRSLRQPLGPDIDVYVADTIGEMGLWYRLSPIVFLGGSLARVGGHNPVEPARLGAAILAGPQTFNFADIYAAMIAFGAARRVRDAADLEQNLRALLSGQSGLASAMGRAALEFVENRSPALNATMEALQPLLRRVRPHSSG